MTWPFWKCTCIPKMNCIGQGFQKLEQYRQTHRTENITMLHWRVEITCFRHTACFMKWQSREESQVDYNASVHYPTNNHCKSSLVAYKFPIQYFFLILKARLGSNFCWNLCQLLAVSEIQQALHELWLSAGSTDVLEDDLQAQLTKSDWANFGFVIRAHQQVCGYRIISLYSSSYDLCHPG